LKFDTPAVITIPATWPRTELPDYDSSCSRCIPEEVVPWIYHDFAPAAIVSGSQTRIAVRIVLLTKLIVITVRVSE
jgi:hypothetical protein